VNLARHIPRIPLAIAPLALVAGLAISAAASPQAPRTRTQAPPARRVDPKKEARKAPPLSMVPSWTITLPGLPSAAAGVDAANAYIPLRSSELVAVALSDGKVAWSVPIADVVAPPETGEGLVFIAHAQEMEALDASTGAPRWRAPVDAPISAPLFSQGGWLLAVTDRGDATMFRASSGDVLWKQPLGAAVRVRPAAADDHVYFALEDGRVAALALETGKAIWEAKLPAGGTTLHALDDRIFVGDGDKFFYCLSADRGKTKWRWRTGGAVVGVTAVDVDRVYFVSLDNVLRALNRSNGNQAWKALLPHRPTAGPFIMAHLLIVPGMSAEVPAFRVLDGSAAGTAKLPGEPAAPPSFLPAPDDAHRRLLVLTGDGQAQLLVPGAPPLPSKPIPGLPAFTLPPEIKEGDQISTGAL